MKMKHYTESIPLELAKKLKEAGYWNPGCAITSQYNNACYFKDGRFYEGVIADWEDLFPAPSFAEVFDWFLDKGIEIEIYLSMTRLDAAKNPVEKIYAWNVYSRQMEANGEEDSMSWIEAADAAITKALELI